MRLLIVEDEKDIADPLKRVLEKKGFAVDYVDNGKDALEEAQMNEYDCILLDLNLPEVDGIEVSKKLRAAQNDTPIIMVTARSQLYDKLEGFDKGADDYVTKPFDLSELIARINAVIKRNSNNTNDKLVVEDPENNIELELITERNLVIVDGIEIELSNKETGILEYLIRNKGRIVSGEEILEHVWDREADMLSETVKTHIKTLRQKCDPDKKIIKTVRGKGYVIN